jgi:hypothetical protein
MTMLETSLFDSKTGDPACEAILEFLVKHPHARFNRKVLLTIGWLDAGVRAERAVDHLREAGLVGWQEDDDLYYLAQ